MYFDLDINSRLMDFLWKITSSNEYDYVILMSRKMYSFFRSYDIPRKEKPIIISSDAVPFLRDSFKGKKVLVVDDILIHGRTMGKIGSLLSDKVYGTESINYTAFIVDESALPKLAESKELCNLTYFLSLPRYMWRQISRQIVERIRATLTPLRFAVCYALLNTTLSQEDLTNILNAKGIVNSDPEFRDVDSYVWRPEFYCASEYSKGLIDHFYIRIDFSRKQPYRVLVVPQVFLKPLNEVDVHHLYSQISTCSIPSESEDKCRFLEYAISQWGLKKALSELQSKLNLSDASIKTDNSDLDYSFSVELSELARKESFFNQLERIVTEEVKKYSLNVNEGNTMEAIGLSSQIQDTSAYLRYLCECGFADELMYELNEPKRIEGARLQFLLQSLNVNPIDVLYSLALSITTYQYVLLNKWITMRVIPGESAFSYMLLKNKRILFHIQDAMLSASELNMSDNEIVSRFTELLESNHEDLTANLFAILTSLREHLDERRKNYTSKIEDNDETRNKYIQYMTDIQVHREYTTEN